MQLYAHKLSPSFKYAGVIAGAGAIMDLNLITEKNMIPTKLFHGNADVLVPYGTASHHYCPPNSSGWLMFFGSKSIAQHLGGLNGTFELTTFQDGGHAYAGAYFYQNQQPIADFISKVISGQNIKLYQTIKTKK